MQDIQKLPSRIRYYLLDWKDNNMKAYLELYPGTRLRDLTTKQLHELYNIVVAEDLSKF